MALGSPEAFFRLTPRQFDLAVQGALRARRTEYNARIQAAYLSGALPNMKRPPRLNELLAGDSTTPRRRIASSAESEARARARQAALAARKSRNEDAPR